LGSDQKPSRSDRYHFQITANLEDMQIMAIPIVVQAGDRFGKFTVIAEAPVRRKYDRYFLVQCDCGSEPREVRLHSMKSGRTVGCGCSRGLNKTKFVKAGETYGRLTVVRELEVEGYERTIVCSCSCGSGEKEYSFYLVRSGSTLSCGCLVSDVNRELRKTHGKSDTKIYGLWASMRARCSNKNDADYGARGISVCDEWHDFEAFESWAISAGYQHGLEIDRENNEKGYNPDNCRFITKGDNCRNRSRSRIWHVAGRQYSSARLAAEQHNVTTGTIKHWARDETTRVHPTIGECSSVPRYRDRVT